MSIEYALASKIIASIKIVYSLNHSSKPYRLEEIVIRFKCHFVNVRGKLVQLAPFEKLAICQS